MAKPTEVIIAGKRYPMRFSMAASKAITKRFGGLKDMGETMFSEKENEALDAVTYVVTLLIEQGCAYKNLFEKDEPVPEDARVDKDGNYIPITGEELDIALGIGDEMKDIMDKIKETIFGPEERKIEAKEIETKNTEAT